MYNILVIKYTQVDRVCTATWYHLIASYCASGGGHVAVRRRIRGAQGAAQHVGLRPGALPVRLLSLAAQRQPQQHRHQAFTGLWRHHSATRLRRPLRRDTGASEIQHMTYPY